MRGCRFGWPDVAGRPGPVTSGWPSPGRLTRTRPAQSGRLTRTGRPHPSRTCVAARARPNLRSRRVSDIGPPRAIHRWKADWQGFHSHYNSAQSDANKRRTCTCTFHRRRPQETQLGSRRPQKSPGARPWRLIPLEASVGCMGPWVPASRTAPSTFYAVRANRPGQIGPPGACWPCISAKTASARTALGSTRSPRSYALRGTTPYLMEPANFQVGSRFFKVCCFLSESEFQKT